jgi:hypothetical protein
MWIRRASFILMEKVEEGGGACTEPRYKPQRFEEGQIRIVHLVKETFSSSWINQSISN